MEQEAARWGFVSVMRSLYRKDAADWSAAKRRPQSKGRASRGKILTVRAAVALRALRGRISRSCMIAAMGCLALTRATLQLGIVDILMARQLWTDSRISDQNASFVLPSLQRLALVGLIVVGQDALSAPK